MASRRLQPPGMCLVITFAIALGGCVNSSAQSKPTPTICGGNASIQPAEIEAAVRRFILDWNEHNEPDFGRLLTADAELDMSTQTQGVNQDDNWTTVAGSAAIERFARTQWNAGETLSFSSVQTVTGGANVIGLTATFADRRRQTMTDAKFVYNACTRSFRHIVIVASASAK